MFVWVRGAGDVAKARAVHTPVHTRARCDDRKLTMPTYRLHDCGGDDLGLLEHPAPNVEPGDVVLLADGREALVTARVEAEPGQLEALLEVVIVDYGVALRRLTK